MSQISIHVLDISTGKPAEGITAFLKKHDDPAIIEEISRGITNHDGRIADLVSEISLSQGVYELVFEVDEYFSRERKACFYPRVSILFKLGEDEHCHIPLLLSPFGYSTYRGS